MFSDGSINYNVLCVDDDVDDYQHLDHKKCNSCKTR